MDYRSGKWAKEILDSRNEEGMWGNFHTLAQPVRNKAITTQDSRIYERGRSGSGCPGADVPMRQR